MFPYCNRKSNKIQPHDKKGDNASKDQSRRPLLFQPKPIARIPKQSLILLLKKSKSNFLKEEVNQSKSVWILLLPILVTIQLLNDIDKPFNYFNGYVFGIDFMDLLGYLNGLLG